MTESRPEAQEIERLRAALAVSQSETKACVEAVRMVASGERADLISGFIGQYLSVVQQRAESAALREKLEAAQKERLTTVPPTYCKNCGAVNLKGDADA